MLHFMREASKIGTTREDDTSVLSSLDARTTCRNDQLGQISHPPIPATISPARPESAKASSRPGTRLVPCKAAAGDHLLLLQGVAEMIPTARVQQGLS